MFEKYKRYYTAAKLIDKLTQTVKRIGRAALRKVLTLYVILKRKDVPLHVKLAIIAVLGYLICPVDMIPDFVPGGLVDDLAAISLLLAEISIFETAEVISEVDRLVKQFE